uniref:Transcriptional coactivator p15 (PC4) C-terminal domain-containing protein n=1 Tax=Globodera rostochiensis TaxID=31243 RepID=A0A914HGD9_GLORO
MSDDSTLTDSSVDSEVVPAKKSKIQSKKKETVELKSKNVADKKKKAKVMSEESPEDEDSGSEKVKGSEKTGSKTSNRSPDSSGDELEKDDKKAVKRERDQQGNEIIPIGGNRFISVDRFKGRILIGIREYYQKDGKWFPGKKGISLNQDQYQAFLKVLPDVKKMLNM